MADSLQITRPEPGVVVLTLDRPDRLNALDIPTVTALTQTLAGFAAEPSTRVVVLTGAGRGFCAGLDLAPSSGSEGAGGGGSGGPVGRLHFQETFAGMVRAIRATPQPVIAAVNGPAAGAGMALALACDVRVMAASATFHVAAVKLGITAGECGLTYHLPRHIGTGKAFEILLSGRPVDATEAEALGLVTRVVPDREVVDAAAAVARPIMANSPYAVWQTKRLMWANLDASFDQAIELENRTQILGTFTGDHVEAVRAFNEKRSPNFTGT